MSEIIIPGAENKQPNLFENLNALMAQMQHLAGYLKHVEQGLIQLSQEVQAQGLAQQMVYQLLMDKELATKEEISKYYEKYVFEPMKAASEEMQKKITEAMEAAQQKQGCNCEEEKCADCSCEDVAELPDPLEAEEDSSVVLASEANNVVRFPGGK